MTTSNIINKINLSDIKEVSITAKHWFQKSYGNTYHSVSVSVIVTREAANKIDPTAYPLTEHNKADVWIDIAYSPFVYGYERMYDQTALGLFEKHVCGLPMTPRVYLSLLCRAVNIPFSEEVIDVNRKKDL